MLGSNPDFNYCHNFKWDFLDVLPIEREKGSEGDAGNHS